MIAGFSNNFNNSNYFYFLLSYNQTLIVLDAINRLQKGFIVQWLSLLTVDYQLTINRLQK